LGRKRETAPFAVLFKYTGKKKKSQKEHATPSGIDPNQTKSSMMFSYKSKMTGRAGLQLNK
jgi:hypothetical protein